MSCCISFFTRILDKIGCFRSKENIKKSDAFVPQNFTITAHTGALLTKRNSVKSVVTSIKAGADIVEVDVTFRKDGTVVIIHSDAPANNEGVLFENIAKELAKSHTVKANLDLKAYSNTSKVQEILSRYKLLDRAFFTGVFPENVEQVKKGAPLIPYYINGSLDKNNMNNDEYLNAFAKEIAALGALGLNTHFSCINKKVTDIMHSHGLLVSAWTVNRCKDQCRILSYGVDNITTTSPAKLMAILKSIKNYERR